MAKLIFKSGDKSGEEYDILQDAVRIGRESDNSVQILDEKASRHHCVITRKGHTYFLKDMGTTNGTFVNGRKITDAKLRSGDVIRIGEIVFVLEKSQEEMRKGTTTIIRETEKKSQKGKGYNTMLAEIVGEVSRHDVEIVKKKEAEGQTSGFGKRLLSRLGWGEKAAEKLEKKARGEIAEDIPAALVSGVSSPKSNEKLVTLTRPIKGIDASSIVTYAGKDYFVLEAKETPSGGVQYRLKLC